MDEADNFNFNKYWGPDDYRPRVVFKRGSDMQCVYCGEVADTREHCPSKVFLTKPYPSDLPVVPACEKCNNGFSADELYTKAFIEAYEQHCSYKATATLSERKEVKEAREKFEECVSSGKIHLDDRISRILIKLAICHMTYELTTGFYDDSWEGVPEYVSYTFRPNMTTEEIEAWDDFVIMNDNILPIIGSRAFNHIYVFEPVLSALDEAVVRFIKGNFMENRLFMDLNIWNRSFEDWLIRTGNGRVHDTTKRKPCDMFLEEQVYLRPLLGVAPDQSANDTERTVRKDNTILYRSNRYALLLGTYSKQKKVVIEPDKTKLNIYTTTGDKITTYPLCLEKGRLIKADACRRETDKKMSDRLDKTVLLLGEEFRKYLTTLCTKKPRYTKRTVGAGC
jgi:hypothetical protein